MRDKKCKRQLNLVFNGIWLLTLFIERPLYWVRYKKSGQSSIRDLVSKDVQVIILKIVGALLILKHRGSCRRPINLKCVISSFCSTWNERITIFGKNQLNALHENKSPCSIWTRDMRVNRAHLYPLRYGDRHQMI